MAKVYLALMAGPAGFNKLMVLKVLREEALTGPEDAIAMFWDEARLSAQMEHPNIVHTYEVGQEGSRYYMAMEYLDGQTYRNAHLRCARDGGMPLAEHLRILALTARGLQYAHELRGFNGEPLGVVHRDVSPQNVFVTYDGQVKLLDFGIAKARGAENLTQVGVIKGKFDYIAPEQLRGETLDGRADVFALGVMLWEAVTGKRFAGGRSVPDVAKAHARLVGGEPNVRTVVPDVPEALAAIVDRATALQPDARLPDAATFADALEAYLESTGERPSAKSLSALIAPLFASERAATQKLIDQQVQLSQSGIVEIGESTGSLPRWGTRSSMSSIDGSGLMPLPPQQSVVVQKPAPRTPSRRGMTLAVALTVAAGAALAISSEPPPASSPASQSTAAPPIPAEATEGSAPAAASLPASPDASSVVVNINVQPASARVLLDGAPISASFSGEFRASADLHHVEAVAPGYRVYKRLLAFDKDQTLRIVLEPLPAPRPIARRGPPSRAPSAEREQSASSEVSAAPAEAAAKPADSSKLVGEDLVPATRTKRRDIDVSDPYAVR